MKAILEFNLPEEQHEHQDAIQGSQWKLAMGGLISYLRNEIKHVDHTAEEYDILHKVREEMSGILKERGLDLY